ncbi:hypothetical protein GVI05_19525 [Escherichia coli]|nr:hypothetical protein [Escherichia coli]
MNYLEFPDGSLFWQQTTYLRWDMSYQIQYRSCGRWVCGNSFKTKEQAEQYAKQTGQDYQIVKTRR